MSKSPLFAFVVPPYGTSPTLAFGVVLATGERFRFSFHESRAALYLYPAPGAVWFRPVALLENQRTGHERAYPADDRHLRFEADLWLGDDDGRAGRALISGLLTHWLNKHVSDVAAGRSGESEPSHCSVVERTAAALAHWRRVRAAVSKAHDLLAICQSADRAAGDVVAFTRRMQDVGEPFDYLPQAIKSAESMARNVLAFLRVARR